MQEIWNKVVRFCNYQERCRHDVLKKLRALEVKEPEAGTLIQKLEAENLLNEKRFVQQFVNGRFKYKKWGRKKIEIELKRRNISPTQYKELLDELLPAENYQLLLTELANRKYKTIKGESTMLRKQKLFRFLAGKGFESEQINAVIKRVS